MIGKPFVRVRCDGDGPNGLPCRNDQVVSLPSFFTDEAQLSRLFLTLFPEWSLQSARPGRALCPQCRRIEAGKARVAFGMPSL